MLQERAHLKMPRSDPFLSVFSRIQRYLDLLQNQAVLAIANLFPHPANHRLPRDDICFQQDGAPAHYGQNVREHLYQVFHNNGLVGDVT
ncbi:hypothetical protein ANN_26905 [Periplaneta americana]|uniref:Uncharacterized protein n=1 Tax=Periplaneta americana TaxID=6978 RepID=A0ABQ8RWN3_PERAM|nr:hypothetical protein ANN_26905 [Periplaneta americana]